VQHHDEAGEAIGSSPQDHLSAQLGVQVTHETVAVGLHAPQIKSVPAFSTESLQLNTRFFACARLFRCFTQNLLVRLKKRLIFHQISFKQRETQFEANILRVLLSFSIPKFVPAPLRSIIIAIWSSTVVSSR
jgi:hypothetical protein